MHIINHCKDLTTVSICISKFSACNESFFVSPSTVLAEREPQWIKAGLLVVADQQTLMVRLVDDLLITLP